MIHAFVPRKTEPETTKPIMFSISEVEGIIGGLIESLNSTKLVRVNDLKMEFIPNPSEAGGVVFVRQGKEMFALPVMLTHRKKGGE